MQIRAVLDELYKQQRETERYWHYEARVAVGDMFAIALQTGMRAGEVRRIKKSDVRLQERVIIVHSKKGLSKYRSGRTREVPINDEVHDILTRRLEKTEGEYLFPNRTGNGPLADHLTAFKSACMRANIPYGLNGGGTLIFNDARRTALNHMLDAGHSPRAVGDIMGMAPDDGPALRALHG